MKETIAFEGELKPAPKRLLWLDRWIQASILATVFFLVLSPVWTTVFLLSGTGAWLLKLAWIKGCRFQKSPFDLWICLFAVISSGSIFVSPDAGFSFYNFYNLMGRYLLIYYLVVQNIKTLRQLKWLVAALFLSGGYTAYCALEQYVRGVDMTGMLWVDGEQFPELKTRVYATLKNPNLYAGYLLVLLFLLVGFMRTAMGKWRIALGVGFGVFLVCLGLTYCRGAWLTLAGILFGYGLLKNRVVFLAMAVLGAGLIFIDTSITERFLSAFDASDSSSQMRMGLWESTFAMIVEHPLLGIGWGAYWMVYPYYDFFVQNADVRIVHAHNMYLNIAAETGVFGLAAFSVNFFGHMHLALSRFYRRQDRFLNGLLCGIGLALISIAVNGLTDYVLFNIELSMLFWLLCAVAVVICRERLD